MKTKEGGLFMLAVVKTDKYNKIINDIKANGFYCPCRLEKTPDTKCPCREFREQTTEGECHCGAYKKVEVSDE